MNTTTDFGRLQAENTVVFGSALGVDAIAAQPGASGAVASAVSLPEAEGFPRASRTARPYARK